MIVYVDYSISDKNWYYYYFDKDGYRFTTQGFDTHIIASNHAQTMLRKEIIIKYK